MSSTLLLIACKKFHSNHWTKSEDDFLLKLILNS